MLSVIIPTYNGLDMLCKSLPTWFEQTFPTEEYEVIVVDNRSTDDTQQYVESLLPRHKNLIYLYEPKPGATNRIMGTDIVAYSYWHHETSICGSFDRYYPARTIIERCVQTSTLLFAFVTELHSWNENGDENIGKYESVIANYTKSHYVNQLPILLCRTKQIERRRFYKRIQERSDFIETIHELFNKSIDDASVRLCCSRNIFFFL